MNSAKFILPLLVIVNSLSMNAQINLKVIEKSIVDMSASDFVMRDTGDLGFSILKDKKSSTFFAFPRYDKYALEVYTEKDAFDFVNGLINGRVEVPVYLFAEKENIRPESFLSELDNYLVRLRKKIKHDGCDFKFDRATLKTLSDTLYPVPTNDEELSFLLDIFIMEIIRRETNSTWEFERITTLNPFFIPYIANSKQKIIVSTGEYNSLCYRVDNAISIFKKNEVLIPDFEKILKEVKKKGK